MMTDTDIQKLANTILEDPTFVSRIVGAIMRKNGGSDSDISKSIRLAVTGQVKEVVSSLKVKDQVKGALDVVIHNELKEVADTVKFQVKHAVDNTSFCSEKYVEHIVNNFIGDEIREYVRSLTRQMKTAVDTACRNAIRNQLSELKFDVDLSDLFSFVSRDDD